MCHTHTTHFSCTHTHTHLELCCAAISPLVATAIARTSSRGRRRQWQSETGQPHTPPRAASPSSLDPISSFKEHGGPGSLYVGRTMPAAAVSPLSSSSSSPCSSSRSSPGPATSPLTPPSAAPETSPSPFGTPAPSSSESRPQPHAHQTAHTTAPSASVCVNCTGPPLEYPYPYPFARNASFQYRRGRRIPDLDVFNIAGTVSAWDAFDSPPTSTASSPTLEPTDLDAEAEHLAATLTVSVALPLRHDPYADGEAAPDVVPFVARRMKTAAAAAAAPNAEGIDASSTPPLPPQPQPQPTCPKAPRLRPVRVDSDAGGRAYRGKKGLNEGGASVGAVEIEGLSLDDDGDDGDGDGDGDEGVVEAAAVGGVEDQQIRRKVGESARGEEEKVRKRRVTGEKVGGRRRGRSQDDGGPGLVLRLWHGLRAADGRTPVNQNAGNDKEVKVEHQPGNGTAKAKAKL